MLDIIDLPVPAGGSLLDPGYSVYTIRVVGGEDREMEPAVVSQDVSNGLALLAVTG